MARKKNPRKGAEEFFYEHAGYSYDPKTQTEEEGRRATAKALANAEQWAWDNNYEFEWNQEIEDWGTFLDGTEIGPEEVSDIVSVVMRTEDGEGVEALGGIIEGYDNEHNRNYRRVVEAELAREQQTEPWEFKAPKRNPGTNWWGPGNEWVQKEAQKEYQVQLRAHTKRGRKKSTFRYTPPQWQQEAMEALGDNDEERFKAIKMGQLGTRGLPPLRDARKRNTNPGASAADLVRKLKF